MKTTPTGMKQASVLLPGIALIASVLMLAACGDKPAPPQLLQQERQTLDKAKGLEQNQAQQTEEMKREAEKQTQ